MKTITPEQSMLSCVRCGACRSVCPTLHITGKEADGPRGRVFMARQLIEGKIPANEEIKNQLDRCLLCSACVDACPIDVQVPNIVLLAKEKIASSAEGLLLKNEKKEQRPANRNKDKLEDFLFDKVLTNKNHLNRLGSLLRFYQKSGLQNLSRKIGILKFFPEQLRKMEQILPTIPPRAERKPFETLVQRENKEKRAKGKVAFFTGCIMDVMFRETNQNTVKLLTKAGFDVVIPEQQVCCGALHHHNGKKEIAIELAKQNIEQFEKIEVDYIVSNAGGCGAALYEYSSLLMNDIKWAKRGEEFSKKIRDVCDVILEKGELPEMVGTGARVTYQPSCHLQYVMEVKEAPVKLVEQVKNDKYVELPDKKYCCGSAGIYNLHQPELANDILAEKMKRVEEVEPTVLLTANPGCHLQLELGTSLLAADQIVETKHVVDYLIESIERAEMVKV